jgi:hypothetical protein
MLGDDLAEDEGIPSYLREEGTELPDFVDEPPVIEVSLLASTSLVANTDATCDKQKEPARMNEGII